MNDDRPLRKLFHSFREAKAPPGFADKVMAHIHSDKIPAHRSPHRETPVGKGIAPTVGGTEWSIPPGRNPRAHRGIPAIFLGRWAWTGGLALAASVILMVSHKQAPPPISTVDISFYLGESTDLEENANLGTKIERYFL